MSKSRLFSSLLIATALSAGALVQTAAAAERDQIRAVGSSTVFPFVTIAAEQFGKLGKYKTPIVESTGTGGGIKLFCSGAGNDSPDLSNASRPIKDSEVELCKQNGVTDITEIKIGFDGIVIAEKKQDRVLKLTKSHVFLALARQVPQNGELVTNPYTNWNEIDASLPNQPISVYGPPPTSGTRDAFVELLMEPACEAMPEFEAAYPDKKDRQKACGLIREDGKYIQSGEDDNVIVQKLVNNATALGIFGYSFLEENSSKVEPAEVDGEMPTFENISSGKYSLARSLFVYVKNAHLKTVEGLGTFVRMLTSESQMGESGAMVKKGLIPLPIEERTAVREKVNALQ